MAKEKSFHHFSTGAVRSADAQAERWDLIPILGLWRLARTCAAGAAKYGESNWQRGIPVSDLVNHAIRHNYLYLAGERSEDHLAHAAWNQLAACHMELIQPEMVDPIWQVPELSWEELEKRLAKLFWNGGDHAKAKTSLAQTT